MYLALSSASRDSSVGFAYCQHVAAALEVQLYRDYARFWESSGCPVRAYRSPDDIPRDAEVCPLIIFDTADQADSLGYHSVDARGRAYGKAFWEVIRDNGGTLLSGASSLSVTLSHEALEMIGDPYVAWWADIDADTQEALELCDRVQADWYGIDGVSVSNFLGPRAFRAGDGPYDYMRLLTHPWEIRPGGYAIRRKGGEIVFTWDAKVPEWKREAKLAAQKFGRKAGKREGP